MSTDVWAGVVKMVQIEGPQALWRGLVPTMFRDIPFSAVYWMVYEQVKSQLLQKTHQNRLSPFQIAFLSGASSGMLAAVITTPFDVIKTQRQISTESLTQIIQNIMIKDGPAGYFRGVVPRAARVAPACAIMISSYEMGKLFFANRKKNAAVS